MSKPFALALLLGLFVSKVYGGLHYDTHRWAAVLLDYCISGDDCSMQGDVATITKNFVDRDHSVTKLVQAVSYGKLNLKFDYIGWIHATAPLANATNASSVSDRYAACYPRDKDRFRYLLEFDSTASLNDYNGFIFVIRRPISNINCDDSSILSEFEAALVNTYTEQEQIFTRIVMTDIDAVFDPGNVTGFTRISSPRIVQKIFHSYGLQSSDAIVCITNNDYENQGSTNSGTTRCSLQEHGDLFSIMGTPVLGSHLNPVDLDTLGWIKRNEDMQIVTLSGQYTLYPLEHKDSSIKALRIVMKTPIHHLTDEEPIMSMDRVYVHYRTFTGYDANDYAIPLKNGSSYSKWGWPGVFIHAAHCSPSSSLPSSNLFSTDSKNCRAMLLDMHPSSKQSAYERDEATRIADAMLYVNEHQHLKNNIEIETISIAPGKSVTVKILLDDAPSRIIIGAVTPPSSNNNRQGRLFKSTQQWNKSVAFDLRRDDHKTNFYIYSIENIHFSLLHSQPGIEFSGAHCPDTVDIEVIESFGGGGLIATWTTCSNGVLDFIGFSENDHFCNYEAKNLQIALFQSSSKTTTTCESIGMHYISGGQQHTVGPGEQDTVGDKGEDIMDEVPVTEIAAGTVGEIEDITITTPFYVVGFDENTSEIMLTEPWRQFVLNVVSDMNNASRRSHRVLRRKLLRHRHRYDRRGRRLLAVTLNEDSLVLNALGPCPNMTLIAPCQEIEGQYKLEIENEDSEGDDVQVRFSEATQLGIEDGLFAAIVSEVHPEANFSVFSTTSSDIVTLAADNNDNIAEALAPSEILIRTMPTPDTFQGQEWDMSISFEGQVTELDTNVQVYSKGYMWYKLSSMEAIGDTGCPEVVDLEAFDSIGGAGNLLSSWTVCKNGALNFSYLTVGDYTDGPGTYDCNYQFFDFEIRSFSNSATITCEDIGMLPNSYVTPPRSKPPQPTPWPTPDWMFPGPEPPTPSPQPPEPVTTPTDPPTSMIFDDTDNTTDSTLYFEELMMLCNDTNITTLDNETFFCNNGTDVTDIYYDYYSWLLNETNYTLPEEPVWVPLIPTSTEEPMSRGFGDNNNVFSNGKDSNNDLYFSDDTSLFLVNDSND